MIKKNLLSLVRLEGIQVAEQLALEEALLRVDSRNFCILNHNVPPAVVMGISAKEEEVLEKSAVCPLIRRFSGGGTVFVDENTCFVTFILNHDTAPISPYPKEILQWTKTIYKPALSPLDFRIEENDYVLGNKKFGGNAQYIQKERWLHHSTLLFDYNPESMQVLKFPKKTPQYRAGRSHADFLCSLKPHFSSIESLQDNIIKELKQAFFVQEISLKEVEAIKEMPHRKMTKVLYGGV